MSPFVFTVTWSDESGPYQFVATRPAPVLFLPDGREVALPLDAWGRLRDVLHLLPPAAPADPEPDYLGLDWDEPRRTELDDLPPPRGPARRGKVWDDAEEAYVREAWARGEDAATIGAHLERSRGAVTARLVKLGLVEEAEANLRFPPGRVVAAPQAQPSAE